MKKISNTAKSVLKLIPIDHYILQSVLQELTGLKSSAFFQAVAELDELDLIDKSLIRVDKHNPRVMYMALDVA